jgi:hypothetical protein
MGDEPTIRVKNGSMTVTIVPGDGSGTVSWSQEGPWLWVRIGPPSDRAGDRWIDVNDEVIGGAGPVRVSTSDGVLFFSYQHGRTFLESNIPFVPNPRNPRQLVFGTSVVDVAVTTMERIYKDGWRSVPVPEEDDARALRDVKGHIDEERHARRENRNM